MAQGDVMEVLQSALTEKNSQLWKTWEPNHNAVSFLERLNANKPVRIIGPCAVQSREQMETITSVLHGCIDGLRAPFKKPRTRPVNPDGKELFTGIGLEQAKPIYKRAHDLHPNVAMGMEVMNAEDIRSMAATGLLGFAWSGSRTQEQETLRNLGKAARETNTLMMIKNPLVPDHELFLGMMENWILGAENALPLMVCVRGQAPYTSEEKSQWRNVPNIHVISLLKAAFPDLPVILDPSHMVKKPANEKDKATRLHTVVQLIEDGLAVGANGYMVEVHHPNYPSLTDPGENVYDLMNELDKRGLLD